MSEPTKNKPIIHNRTSHLLKNVSGTLLSRTVNFSTNLFIVPLAIKALGVNDYGVFAVILSATLVFSYSDLGLGLAVVNKVAAAKDQQSLLEARTAISNVWYFLTKISGLILILGLLTLWVLSTSGYSGAAFAWESWLTLIVCVVIGLAPGLTQRILFGLQKNIQANLWNTAAKLLSVLGIYLAYYFHASMMWFVAAMIGLPAIVGWLNTFMLWRNVPELRPIKLLVDWDKLRGYIHEGLQFLFLQLGVFFETGIDNILIGAVLGSVFVTNYDLLTRLFIYVPALISMLAFPLWPAIRHAKVSGDEAWVKKIMAYSFLGVGFVSVFFSGVFLYFHSEIIHLWVGVKYEPNFELAWALAAFAVLTSIGSLQAMLLFGMGRISAQVRMLVVFLVLLIPAKYICLSKSGPALMVWILVGLYICRLIALWCVTKKISKKKQQISLMRI